jgi:hypothetical protein
VETSTPFISTVELTKSGTAPMMVRLGVQSISTIVEARPAGMFTW